MMITGAFRDFFTRLQASVSGPTSDAPSGADRFTVRRKQRMRHGYVSCPARPAFPAQLCNVTEASFHGVRVEMTGPPPDSSFWENGVRLYLVAENHEFDCIVAWQKGAEVGLRFQGRPKPPSRVYG